MEVQRCITGMGWLHGRMDAAYHLTLGATLVSGRHSKSWFGKRWPQAGPLCLFAERGWVTWVEWKMPRCRICIKTSDFNVVILDIQAFVFDPSTGLYIYPPNASGWTLASSFRGLIQFALDALSDWKSGCFFVESSSLYRGIWHEGKLETRHLDTKWRGHTVLRPFQDGWYLIRVQFRKNYEHVLCTKVQAWLVALCGSSQAFAGWIELVTGGKPC